MKISVRDYRGCERADIELAPIALLAGRNEQGKSSVAEAVQAILTGAPIVVPGVTKKDAKLLVRDGAESGTVQLDIDDVHAGITWPQAIGGDSFATTFAVGLAHPFEMDARTRAHALETYIDAKPNKADVESAARDIGYSDEAIEKLWQAVSADWDGTYTRARSYSTKLKGQWEEATDEKWGSKKAAGWMPKGVALGTDETEEQLQAAVKRAEQNVLDLAGNQAVSQAEIARLKEVIAIAERNEDPLPELRKQIDETKTELETLRDERRSLPASDGETVQRPIVPCPACGVELTIEPVHNAPPILRERTEEQQDPETVRQLQRRKAGLDGSIGRVRASLDGLERRLATKQRVLSDAQAAQKRLQELEGHDEGATAEDIAAAKEAQIASQQALSAFMAKQRADEINGQLQRNEALVAVLAPEGLRRRKLAEGLEEFNDRLRLIADSAGWPKVRFDNNLAPHYGTRPVWAASKSGQWRARAMVQLAMAQIDESEAIVLDEADVLDARGRNALFSMLAHGTLKALVCMTINKSELVPDLAKAGIGHSYWIENGISSLIESA